MESDRTVKQVIMRVFLTHSLYNTMNQELERHDLEIESAIKALSDKDKQEVHKHTRKELDYIILHHKIVGSLMLKSHLLLKQEIENSMNNSMYPMPFNLFTPALRASIEISAQHLQDLQKSWDTLHSSQVVPNKK
jgi:hypothetical protein